jgi:hypothetical protein
VSEPKHALNDEEHALVEELRKLARDLELWLGVHARPAAERRLGVEVSAPVDGGAPYQEALTVVSVALDALRDVRRVIEAGTAVASPDGGEERG